MVKKGIEVLVLILLVVAFAGLTYADDAFNPLHGGDCDDDDDCLGGKGAITICKIIIDQNNNVVPGPAGTTFSMSGFTPSPTPSTGEPIGQFGTKSFVTPLTYDADLLSNVPGNDAKCKTFSSLQIGGYYYDEEVISNGDFESPEYNDQFTVAVVDLSDFFPYDDKLFDGFPSNDGDRNKNVDGHIVLTSDRKHRTLVVLNRFESEECECNGGVRKITMRYDGAQNGVTVKVYNKGNANDESKLITTFNNVNTGDDLFVDGTGLENGKFKNEIFWLVVGVGGVKVHTSCSQPLFPGQQFGDFTLVHFEDKNGNVCGAECETNADCTDNNVCNGVEQCIDFVCVPGTPLDCDDQDVCTVDSCDTITGCDNEFEFSCPLCPEEQTETQCIDDIDNDCDTYVDCEDPDCFGDPYCSECQTDADCTDNNVCNGVEQCIDFVCVPGNPLICDDGNVCTDDSCHPIIGCMFVPDNSNICADDLFCNGYEYCFNGVCMPDSNPCVGDFCTTSVCDEDQDICIDTLIDDPDNDGVPNGPSPECCILPGVLP